MKSKINCFNCTITQQDIELHNKNYKTLGDLAKDIGLTYNIVANISSGRKLDKKLSSFKYYPKIVISRINKEDNFDLLKKEKKIIEEKIAECKSPKKRETYVKKLKLIQSKIDSL